MEAWIECGDAFIEHDVIRWTEAVFEELAPLRGRRTRRGKAVFLGTREVIAEVLSKADSKGLLRLLVRGCRMVSAPDKYSLPKPIKNETEIRRQKKTLLKNGVERRAWNDETARALVASRFMSNEPPPQTKPDKGEPAANSKRRPSSRRGSKRR